MLARLDNDSSGTDQAGHPPKAWVSICWAQARSSSTAAAVAVCRSLPTMTVPWLTRKIAEESVSSATRATSAWSASQVASARTAAVLAADAAFSQALAGPSARFRTAVTHIHQAGGG